MSPLVSRIFYHRFESLVRTKILYLRQTFRINFNDRVAFKKITETNEAIPSINRVVSIEEQSETPVLVELGNMRYKLSHSSHVEKFK